LLHTIHLIITQQTTMSLKRTEEDILCESHQACSEQEAAANLDQAADICTLTLAVQCCQSTIQTTYNKTGRFCHAQVTSLLHTIHTKYQLNSNL